MFESCKVLILSFWSASEVIKRHHVPSISSKTLQRSKVLRWRARYLISAIDVDTVPTLARRMSDLPFIWLSLMTTAWQVGYKTFSENAAKGRFFSVTTHQTWLDFLVRLGEKSIGQLHTICKLILRLVVSTHRPNNQVGHLTEIQPYWKGCITSNSFKTALYKAFQAFSSFCHTLTWVLQRL